MTKRFIATFDRWIQPTGYNQPVARFKINPRWSVTPLGRKLFKNWKAFASTHTVDYFESHIEERIGKGVFSNIFNRAEEKQLRLALTHKPKGESLRL
ncbi:MAG: hypothetical protein AAF988_04095 [Pseudomonadota bacterium]